jgi:deoxyribodipyrimidine photolyase-related protein
MNLLLFPTNLFEIKHFPKNINKIYLIEDPIFFGYRDKKLNFNKIKLFYHKASMLKYCDYLKSNDYDVTYIEFHKLSEGTKKYTFLKKDNWCCFEFMDHLLEKRIKKINKNIEILQNPNFLIDIDKLNDFYEKSGKKYYHKNFYDMIKKEINVLVGVKSTDTENRNKLPDNIDIPKIPKIKKDKYYIKAKNYIEKHFSDNYGVIDNCVFPYDHLNAKKWLKYFLSNKFANYGKFQDAISDNDNFLFHSTLSPMLNIGLLNPDYIVDETIKFYDNNKKIGMNNLEGFLRQIIGWREYQRFCYLYLYDDIIKPNIMKHSLKLNKSWYDGTTGILPVDDAIKFAFKYAYLNHISRLMIMSNIMNLCQIHPDECYKWFMEFSIDSYDWVMIQNVYSMGQWSDGGLTMRKPYISSSNYILKMSNYKKNDWCNIWNALYYNFLVKNKKIIEKTPYGRNLSYWNKLKDSEKNEILKIAKEFITDNTYAK